MLPTGHIEWTWAGLNLIQRRTGLFEDADYRIMALAVMAPDLLDKPLAWFVFPDANAALFFGSLGAGGRMMQLSAGVPLEMVRVVEGIIVVALAVPELGRLIGYLNPARWITALTGQRSESSLRSRGAAAGEQSGDQGED